MPGDQGTLWKDSENRIAFGRRQAFNPPPLGRDDDANISISATLLDSNETVIISTVSLTQMAPLYYEGFFKQTDTDTLETGKTYILLYEMREDVRFVTEWRQQVNVQEHSVFNMGDDCLFFGQIHLGKVRLTGEA